MIKVQIASIKDSQIPLWVRQQLVGIKIPVDKVSEGDGVFSFSVETLDSALREKSPKAADCFKDHLPRNATSFSLDGACCELVA